MPAHAHPQGVAVAMPIYYSSGSKWKGFLWGCVSGISEPFGALLVGASLCHICTPHLCATILHGGAAHFDWDCISLGSKRLLPPQAMSANLRLIVCTQGYAILRGSDADPIMYALMFGLVAGMMVYISLVELLPTALR